MLHFDYVWDLGPGYIIPDAELKVENLGWKSGQYWQVAESTNGRLFLKKVDPIVQFTLEGKDNG